MKHSMQKPRLVAVVAAILGPCAVGPNGTMHDLVVYSDSFKHCAWVSAYTSHGRGQWKLVEQPEGAPRFVPSNRREMFRFLDEIELQVRAQMTPERNCTKGAISEVSASTLGIRDQRVVIKEAGSGFTMQFKV